MSVAAPSSSTNYLQLAGKVALVVGGLAAVGFTAAAVRFDYKRRNDPQFRKKLLRQHKKLEKVAQKQEEVGKGQVQAALRRAIQLVNAEQVPQTAEGKEQFFMEQVALGEQLAARSPEFYVASAISFYKALKVYPAPQELLMIYQKTQPAAVFDLVMELISLEIADAQAGAPSAASLRSQDPLLEELDAPVAEKEQDEDEEEIQIGSSNPSAPSSTSTDAPSPSSGSSFVHVEGEALLSAQGEVEAAEVEATVVPPEVVEEVKEAVEEVAKELEEKGEIDPPEPTLA
ncbi:hypothetical protein JCM8547_002031 [Rhodosporidiobolus lusitaniae]